MKFDALRRPARVVLRFTTVMVVLGLGFSNAPLGPRALASTPATTAPTSGGLRIGLSFGDTLPGLSPAALAQTLDSVVALGAGLGRGLG